MKQIFLIRHAKSDWTNPELKDIERYLNERGYSNANMMASKRVGNLFTAFSKI